jgi:hypothetical protein
MLNTDNMILIAIGKSNWDYYINENEFVYCKAKVNSGCKDSYYGSLKHFKKMMLVSKDAELTEDAIKMGIT